MDCGETEARRWLNAMVGNSLVHPAPVTEVVFAGGMVKTLENPIGQVFTLSQIEEVSALKMSFDQPHPLFITVGVAIF